MDVALVGCCAATGAATFAGAFVALGGTGARRAGAPRGGTAAARVREALDALPPARLARGRDQAARRAECLRQMPTLLDIVTLGLGAGLSFDASLELYCQHYANELSRSFGEAMLTWRIGTRTREEALVGLADELDLGALRRFARAVSEALAFGTPLAQVLERQSQSIREEQRAQIEEEIERVPVKMLIPLGTLIVPAMLLAILGPLLGSAMVMT